MMIRLVMHVCFCAIFLDFSYGALKAVDLEDGKAFKRIQECCLESGKKINGHEECLRFCRFNTTTYELEKYGSRCAEYTGVWMFCASEGHDHSRCCRDKKVPTQCMGFCRGDLTQLCKERLRGSHFACVTRIRSILQCHAANLKPQPMWQEAATKGSGLPLMKKRC